VSDRQLVSRPQPADFYRIAVDANAIRAAEVADEDRTVLLGQAAMVTRHPERIATCVTRWMPAHHNRLLVYQNVWALVEGHESRGHCGKSFNKAVECDPGANLRTLPTHEAYVGSLKLSARTLTFDHDNRRRPRAVRQDGSRGRRAAPK
jgi:hypothetical protein